MTTKGIDRSATALSLSNRVAEYMDVQTPDNANPGMIRDTLVAYLVSVFDLRTASEINAFQFSGLVEAYDMIEDRFPGYSKEVRKKLSYIVSYTTVINGVSTVRSFMDTCDALLVILKEVEELLSK